MGNLLYLVAVILVIAWLVGFVGYGAGGIIHVLLVIAVIAINYSSNNPGQKSALKIIAFQYSTLSFLLVFTPAGFWRYLYPLH